MVSKTDLLLILFSLTFPLSKVQAQYLFAKPADSSIVFKKFSKAVVVEDIRFMQKIIRQAHPDMYHSISKKEFRRFSDSVIGALPDTSRLYEVSFALSAIAAKLNEGHLGYVSSEFIARQYFQDGLQFPCSVIDMSTAGLVVEHDYSRQRKLNPFDTIMTINGVSIKSLFQKYFSLFGGPDCWRIKNIKNYLSLWLYQDSIHAPFQITAKRNDSIISCTLEGLPFPKNNTNKSATETSQLYTYNILDSTIAYINFKRMTGYHKDFIHFLDSSFTDIKERRIDKLIIDMRYNGGGDSRFGDILLSYINNKAYRTGSYTKFKLSRPSKIFQFDLMNSNIPKWQRSLLKLLPNGLIKKTKYKARVRPTREPFYQGDFCFLIGNGTFSSANIIAAAIKDYKLGTLIGEPTCESCNDYGEIMSFMLPNTQLIAATPSEYFTRPNGNTTDNSPVQPDVFQKQTKEAVLNNTDAVLIFAKSWLGKK